MATKQIVLWLDSEVNNDDDNIAAQGNLSDAFDSVRVFEDEHSCRRYIDKHSREDLFLIVSGRLSREIVPVVDSCDQIVAIYIYCMDSSRHIEWAKGFEKIRGVHVDFQQLISKIHSDLQILKNKPVDSSEDEELSNAFQATSISSSVSKKHSCHLDGYEKVPLCSLEEAIEPLVDHVDDLEQMAWIAKQNAQSPAHGLTADESASIALYTMEWYPKENSVGSILNQALRKENAAQIKPWFRFLRLIFRACSKLPTISQIVYFGTTTDASFDYSSGRVFLSWELMNCTASIKHLENEQTGERTLLTIESRTGKDIRQHAHEQNKDQVLLLPGRQFRVLSSLNADAQLTMVQLEEMKPLFTFE